MDCNATVVGSGSQDPTEAVKEATVARGFLSADSAGRAADEFRASGRDVSFASFLLERGLLSLEQVSALDPAAADVGSSTLVVEQPGPGSDPLVGQRFSGCLVQRKLGQGGMGSVYLARRESDSSDVVVKFLAAEQAGDKAWRGRFAREARLMERISHPNIVAIHSVDADGERPHIVMELVDGGSLEERLAQGPVPPVDAARLARDVALGLAEAHRNGIIHRDIKPANLLVTKGGQVKVLDFGLAKSAFGDDGLSVAGQILGTPHYMAPEQWGDHGVDARCDIYSLGATLYHLVTGTLPFPGHNPQVIAKRAAEGKLASPRAVVREVPVDLELVIYRMMAPDRRLRYQDAKRCADDLERVLNGQPVDVPRLVEAAGPRMGRRHALLPQRTFVVGREPTCDIPVPDASVSRQHARIERTETGFVLHDLGSSYGSFVGDMRVKEVVLKDRDVVRLGKVVLEFRDGEAGVVTRRRARSQAVKVETVLEPVMQALVEESDRRVVLALLENLPREALATRVEAARAALRPLLGGDVAEAASRGLEARLGKARARVPQVLFAITHENLGDAVEAWLAWWDQAREGYPPQIGPDLPRGPARLRVKRGGATKDVFALDEGSVFAIGRDDKSQVALNDLSVSRLHATVLRFHRRFVLRDEGSRFGTLVNDARVRLAFLRAGDRIGLGKVELTFEQDPVDAEAPETGGVHLIDPEAFHALAEQAHPSTAAAHVRFLEEVADLEWVDAEGRRIHGPTPAAPALADRVRRTYQRQVERATALLPRLLGEARPDAPAWRKLLAARDASLPAQVVPYGWFRGVGATEAGDSDTRF